MKKKLLIAWLAVAAALCPTGAWAQALHVSMKDGKVFTFQFSESPKINYSGTAFAVVGDASEISGQMSQVERIYFDNNLSGIVSTQAGAQTLLKSGHGQVTAQGLDEGQLMIVSNLNGQVVGQARAGANGQCSISLASLQPGIYVVRAGSASLKLSLNK
ncbi:MAG: hypothetical protein MRZ38_04605 [Muribaculaceae bacterium]|uniref:hypothetical protein n=1 Tax=Sodaliphilus pleomorphus TaxID=2606626 RepID=UPI0023F06379|nr:hypothetical protein [Sodaliphilus pleomorphus]MCI5980142.1 hypothetical protein [Muribaculaceae bacterium]MCI6170251.1 hypothetical protein [Muribaculaceae bacterium]MDD7065304.1 hypothetical protein [Sodaliphilus pleomorphus]